MIKKYDIVQRRPYPDDQGVVEDVPIESDSGRWVPAEVAEELYKALDDLAHGRGTDCPIEQLLAKARGETE